MGARVRRTRTLPEERRRAILEAIRTRPLVRGDELAQLFGASIETVRRDLLALDSAGLTRRVYGGVTRPMAHPTEPPFEQRRAAHAAAKRAMARLAVSLIEPNDTLLLDIGTSVTEIAGQLPLEFRGRVITNSLLVALRLADRPSVELFVAGGRVRHGDMACYGPHAELLMEGFYGGKAFLGSGGVHPQIGLTDHHVDEVRSRRVIIDHADETFVVADSSKLGQIAPVKVCDISAISAIITDEGADATMLKALEGAGVRVLVARVDDPTEELEAESVPMA